MIRLLTRGRDRLADDGWAQTGKGTAQDKDGKQVFSESEQAQRFCPYGALALEAKAW